MHAGRFAEIAGFPCADPTELLLKEVKQRSAAMVVRFEILHHLDEDSQLDSLGMRLNFLRFGGKIFGAAQEAEDR